MIDFEYFILYRLNFRSLFLSRNELETNFYINRIFNHYFCH